MIDDINKRRKEIGNKRPRYFAGQYLLADDFQLEQDYHIDRQWRENRLLHVSGIAEGLEVTYINATSLKVKEGTAIDYEGRLIVQQKTRTLTLEELHTEGNEIPKDDYKLCIQYQEKAAETQQGTELTESSTRWHEVPDITLESGECKGVVLANVTVYMKGKMKKELEYSDRKYTGLRLPSGPKGTNIDKWPTLRATEAGQVELNGDLKITGNVEIGTTDPKAKLLIEMPKEKPNEPVQGISIKLGENSKGNPIEVFDSSGKTIFKVDLNGFVYSKKLKFNELGEI